MILLTTHAHCELLSALDGKLKWSLIKKQAIHTIQKGYPFFFHHASAVAAKQTTRSTLYSIPFLPPPTTNHPSWRCSKKIPIPSSRANAMHKGVTHLPTMIMIAATISNAVISQAVYGGKPNPDNHESKGFTPPFANLVIPWMRRLPAAAKRTRLRARVCIRENMNSAATCAQQKVSYLLNPSALPAHLSEEDSNV